MDCQQYLKKEFNELNLFTDIFTEKGFLSHLRLEKELHPLKENIKQDINPEYFNRVYNQAIEIFEEIFKEDEEFFFISHIRSEENLLKYPPKINIFKRYLKDQKDKYKVRYKLVTLNNREKIIQYSITLSSKNKLNYRALIKAICNQDFRELKPRFKEKCTYYPEIFFINIRRNIILNIYDDRGCLIVFKNENTFKSFEEKYQLLSIKD